MPCAKSSFCRFASKGTEELFVTLDRKLIGSGGGGWEVVKKIYIRAREINLEKINSHGVTLINIYALL